MTSRNVKGRNGAAPPKIVTAKLDVSPLSNGFAQKRPESPFNWSLFATDATGLSNPRALFVSRRGVETNQTRSMAGMGHRTRYTQSLSIRAQKSDTRPVIALKLLLIPVVLYFNWEFVARYVSPPLSNPFGPFFLLSGYVEGSKPDDPRYAKSWLDFLFLGFYIVFWSMVRQTIAVNIARPIARYFGLRKEAKIDRFGEQLYAMIYFAICGAWGYRVMKQLPTYWYQTEHFWIALLDYPHWDMKGELKRYYLMQFSYWCQQFIVLLLGLEKPRKDYWELVAHHFVTMWLVGWSYGLNFTIIGSAVYMSMDIPDSFLAASKLLNYMQWNRAKIVSFVTFIAVWTYFRHYLNLKILWSCLFETQLVPESSKIWSFENGTYMVNWMPFMVFGSIFALQILNLFWYYLMWRILIRAIITREADDDRSDDEGDDDDEPDKED
ncbi:longevity-assurance protein 1 [Coprinopsis cinerea okayama7|uniref:Longevity-assurance protein 1 n=1 Tax=Coprinopsis cinerea (strain Okayama-7 / 130 / ATCC MYA-4618 / FGSC 9003) TaxID=240176 RepID=A8NXS1_COPC7|nr:longevity-assurance protein 1 [Coprinopsis cinerea okayama7\|eukprot:XP_001837250.2 longevity-assurance protein 1 [Coprinopsis cinerea okayama7\